MCAGVFLLVMNDAAAKWLVTRYDPFQMMFMRSIIALPLIAGLILALDGWRALKTKSLKIHALRGALSMGTAYAFFLSLSALPLAEATSLIFAAPLFVTALSVLLLRDPVGWRRWAAVVCGFAGVLIVVRPGAETFQAASVLAVLAAVLHALVMISTRWIDKRDNIRTLMFYVALMPALLSSFVLFTEWPSIRPEDPALFLAMAVFGTSGITLISQAFRMAQAATVAPFDYTALVWASVLGWIVWSDIPDMWVFVGAAVIIASGVYLILREARTRRRQDPREAAPPFPM